MKAMTISADIYEVAVGAIAIGFLALVAVTVPTLLQIRRTVKAAEDLYAETKMTVEILNGILRKSGAEIEDMAELIKRIKDVGLKITGLTDLLVDTVRSPLMTIVSMLIGVGRGLRHFAGEKDENEKGGVENVRE